MEEKKGFWMLESPDANRYENLLTALGYLIDCKIYICIALDNEQKTFVSVPVRVKSIIKDDKYFLRFLCSKKGDKKEWKEIGPVNKDTVEGFFIPIREYIIQKIKKDQLKNFLLFRLKEIITSEMHEMYKKLQAVRLKKNEKVKEQSFVQAAKLRDQEKKIYVDLIREAAKVAEVLRKRRKFMWVTEYHIAEIMSDVYPQ